MALCERRCHGSVLSGDLELHAVPFIVNAVPIIDRINFSYITTYLSYLFFYMIHKVAPKQSEASFNTDQFEKGFYFGKRAVDVEIYVLQAIVSSHNCYWSMHL